jgi:hypothetical protein
MQSSLITLTCGVCQYVDLGAILAPSLFPIAQIIFEKAVEARPTCPTCDQFLTVELRDGVMNVVDVVPVPA